MTLTLQTAICSCILLVLMPTAVFSLKTKIPAASVECYSEHVEAGASLAFSFDVTHGGQLDLDVVLTATTIQPSAEHDDTHHRVTSLNHGVQTRELDRWTKSSSGQATYTAPTASESGHGLPAKVTACFNNKMSRWTPKWVQFQLYSDPTDPATSTGELDSLASVETELEHALHKEANNLFHVRTLMQKVKQSEEEHRNKVESTGEWTMFGTVMNCVLLIVMSVFQYWWLTKFLSVRQLSMRL